mgnify:CR=1 FL=1
MKNIKKVIMLAGIVATFATSFAAETKAPITKATTTVKKAGATTKKTAKKTSKKAVKTAKKAGTTAKKSNCKKN